MLPVVLNSAFSECQTVDYPMEVIVIDNNTEDDIVQRVRQQCQTARGPVRYVREPSPGLSAARHRGADEAKGELLVYLDDDVELSRGWLAGMLEGFSDDATGMVGGPSIPRFHGSIPTWFWDFVTPAPNGGWHCPWVSLLDIGRPVANFDPNYVWGLNFGIRRSVLYDLGGFHPDSVPADMERWQGDGETGLALRAKQAKIRARFVPEALVYHYVGADRLTVEYFTRRARFQGVCDSFTQIRSGGDPPPAPSPPSQRGARPWQAAAEDVHRATAQAYREGYEFHQREAASDPRLMQWIQRDNFWSADIRSEMTNGVGAE